MSKISLLALKNRMILSMSGCLQAENVAVIDKIFISENTFLKGIEVSLNCNSPVIS
jgi:hypothetical protein